MSDKTYDDGVLQERQEIISDLEELAQELARDDDGQEWHVAIRIAVQMIRDRDPNGNRN